MYVESLIFRLVARISYLQGQIWGNFQSIVTSFTHA